MQATLDELAARSYGRAKTLKFQQPHGLGRLRRLLGITPSDVLDLSGVRTLSSQQGGAFLLRDEEQVTLDVEFKLTHSEAECRVGFGSGHARGSHLPLTVCIRGAGVGTSSGTGFFISASGYTLAAHAFPGVHAGSWHALRAVLRNREVSCTSAHGGSTTASVLSMDVDLDGRALVRELALRPGTLPPAGHVVVVSRTPRRHTLYRGFQLTHGPSSIFVAGSTVHSTASSRTSGDGTTGSSSGHNGNDGRHGSAASATHSCTECPPPARPDLQQVPEASCTAGCSSGHAGGACSACERRGSGADSGSAPSTGKGNCHGAASCSAADGGCRGATDDSAAEPGLLFLELYENVTRGRNDADGGGEQGTGRGGSGADDDWEHVGTEDFNGPDEDRGLGDGCVDFANGDGSVSENGSRRSLDVSQLCAICLSARKQAGFLHGASMHIAACRRCALCFTEGMPCPVCRVKVDRVVTDLYYT